MKKILIVCSFLSMLLLIACGGGAGGGSNNSSSNQNSSGSSVSIDVFSQVSLSSPGFITQSTNTGDTSIYVTDSTATGTIWKLAGDTGALITQSTFQAANGIVSNAGSIFVTGTGSNNNGQRIFNISNLTTPLIADNNHNFGGIISFSSSVLYAADTASTLAIFSINANTITPATPATCALTNPPTALASDGTNIYITSICFSKLMRVASDCSHYTEIASYTDSSTGSLVNFSHPVGMAVLGGYLYILDQGNGDNGAIIKMNLSTGQGRIIVSNTVGNWPANKVGLCGGFGLAVSNDNLHLYATNRSCTTNTVNANTILRITL